MLDEGFFIEGGRYVRTADATPEDYESRRRFLKWFRPGDDGETSGFSGRFRRVSNGYPWRVIEAFDGDHKGAMAATDEEVAAAVRVWEIGHGLEPLDWKAIGQAERAEEDGDL